MDASRLIGFTGAAQRFHEAKLAEIAASNQPCNQPWWISHYITALEHAGYKVTKAEEPPQAYDPRCCHKTVLMRCAGCPYEER